MTIMDSKTEQDIQIIFRTLKNAGHQVYIVGGAVRDIVMERPFKDIDFATDATPNRIMSIFEKSIPTGEKFGTITVVINGTNYEITTFRSDGKYGDSRHPDTVSFAETLDEDVSRRDFTVNGLAMNAKGQVVDLVGGLRDIENQVIRCIGNPNERFKEDPLRMMRACRFKSKLNFDIESATFEAIQKNAPLIQKISQERIQQELMGILKTNQPSIGLNALYDTGLMRFILPELANCKGVTQNIIYHMYDVFDHILAVVDYLPIKLRLAGLFHDVGKPITKTEEPCIHFIGHEEVGARMTQSAMERLKFSNHEIERAVHIVLNHMSLLDTRNWRGGTIRRWINRVGAEYVDDLILFRIADASCSRHETEEEATQLMDNLREQMATMREPVVTKKTLALNGNDVMMILNIPPGRQVGMILNKLEEMVMEDPSINTRERLTQILSQF